MAIELIESLLFNTYQFLASTKVPGFDLSFIQLMFGAMGAIMSIGFLKMFFGLGNPAVSASGIVSSFRSTGGNNKNMKISKNRKGDTR
ncbi:hypothetical protein IJ472_06755 [bacterium]|nr:hypothetical protein [bacterium]